jgi:transcriptional regulator with XRE-family HTH domain
MAFGHTLQRLRQDRGLTQAQLAAASGIPVSTLRDYEQGKRDPLLSNAQKLAKALVMSLDVFAEEQDEAAPAPKRGPGRPPKRPAGPEPKSAKAPRRRTA